MSLVYPIWRVFQGVSAVKVGDVLVSRVRVPFLEVRLLICYLGSCLGDGGWHTKSTMDCALRVCCSSVSVAVEGDRDGLEWFLQNQGTQGTE